MRAWLVAHCTGLPFTEVVVPMRITRPGSGVVAEWVSPTKHVPALHLRTPRVKDSGRTTEGGGVGGASAPLLRHPPRCDTPVVVHDSLAIIDTTIEAMRVAHSNGHEAHDTPACDGARTPQSPFDGRAVLHGPGDPLDRARVRALVCEMHAGFPALSVREVGRFMFLPKTHCIGENPRVLARAL